MNLNLNIIYKTKNKNIFSFYNKSLALNNHLIE